MALATSGTINLTDVRDFYGQSGSINMTALYKGGSYVPNPSSHAVSGTAISSSNGSTLPFDMHPNGGVAPSLASINSSIPTSGSISLTDFYSGYKVVNPSVSNVNLIQTAGSNWNGATAASGKGFYISNYSAFPSTSYQDYAQLMTVSASALAGGTTTSYAEVEFTVSHTGTYVLEANHTGNETNGAYFFIQGRSGSGNGASVDNSNMSMTLRESGGGTNAVATSSSLPSGVGLSGEYFLESGNNTFNASLPQFKLYECVLPAGRYIRMYVLSTAGSAGSYALFQLRTNCNFQRHILSTTSTTNAMLTQG
tara:strand:+ start:125 stop:1054 length:930 start_codon:yes stop_codon:yes gene_type:complete